MTGRNSNIKSELIFIGTGSGRASLKRHHSSFLLSGGNYNLLIDAGDGISRALLSADISYNKIDGILLTHLHPDHYSGLPSLITQMKMNRRGNDLTIFLHKSIGNFVSGLIYHSYLFPAKLKFNINFIFLEDKQTMTLSKGFSFTPRQNTHLEEYREFANQGELSFSCSSFLFNINRTDIFYSGDVGGKDDLYLFKDSKIDLMISEITHISPEEIYEAFRILNAGKLYLTHITEGDESKAAALASRSPSTIIPAFDGMTLTFKVKKAI
jgi:ribonuclease BN (tRNA processing enzyme)